jgi:tRNA threonylcarbamoyladenosine biosynthesis protein TsaB
LRDPETEPAVIPPAAGPVLALDTTGTLGSVALGVFGADATVAREIVRSFEPSRRHSRNLLPAIRELLAEAGLGRDELALLVATRGPGSFTGLRIGLATAQGFALAVGTQLVGVSSLDAAALADAASDGSARRRLVVIDALRGELFAALYDGVGPETLVAGPFRLLPEHAGSWAAEHGAARICGPGVARYRDRMAGGASGFEVVDDRRPLAPAALRLGFRAAREGKASVEASVEPLYLREPDIHGRSVTL